MLLAILLVGAAVVFAEAQDEVTAAFSCDFEEDDCGFVSHPGFSSQWIRQEIELGGRASAVMLLEPLGHMTQFGRMSTPLFELNRTMDGCVTFDLFLHGEGILSFHVEEQDDAGFSDIMSTKVAGNLWRSYNKRVNIDSYITFLFEGRIHPALGESVIAIDNFVFKLNGC